MARRRARGMGSWIPYRVPGHVIGGSEPKSWKASKDAEKRARLRENLKKPNPPAQGNPIKARFDGECPWCGGPVKKGTKISPVHLSESSKTSWVHSTCSAPRESD